MRVEAISQFTREVLLRDEVPPDIGKPVLMPWVNEGTGIGFNKGYGSPKLVSFLSDDVYESPTYWQNVGEHFWQ